VPGSRLLRSWPLQGGISARTTGLAIEMPAGEITQWVLRQHGALTLELNPRIAAAEYRLLQILHAAGVPVPAPHYLEPTGALLGSPCIVVDYIEGQSGIPAAGREHYLEQLASWLARIHAIDASAMGFLPRRDLDPAQQVGPVAQANPPVLLHGDFWPGNVILRDGEVVGVIDWEDAAIGDPLADLASTRIELLWAFDHDAMDRVTELYLAMTKVDPGNLAHWDADAVRELQPQLAHWGLDPDTLREMRDKLAWFEAQVAARLGLC